MAKSKSNKSKAARLRDARGLHDAAKGPNAAPSLTDGVGSFDTSAPHKAPAGTREIKGAGISKWAEGVEVTGMFRSIRGITTMFGDSELVDFELAGGKRVTFGCPVVLGQRLRELSPGVTVVVRCYGKRPTSNGQTAWHFEVFTPGVDDTTEAPF